MSTPLEGWCQSAEGGIAADGVESIAEVWRSHGHQPDNTDSLAAFFDANDRGWVFATMKTGNRVDVIDGQTGRVLSALGNGGASPADAPGSLRRPNGVAILRSPVDSGRPVLVVVERDNRRVQLFDAQDFTSIGVFGGPELVKPYGVAVSYRNGVDVFITDNDVPPHLALHRYRVQADAAGLRLDHVGAIGDPDGRGALIKTESIVADDEHGHLLICDEGPDRNVKVYDLDGRFTGVTFGDGLVAGDPEGIVVVRDDPRDGSAGFIILTDQRKDITLWHVFDRGSYDLVGTFTASPRITNTDGIALLEHPESPGPRDLLLAVDNDTHVTSYRLDDVRRLVGHWRRSHSAPPEATSPRDHEQGDH